MEALLLEGHQLLVQDCPLVNQVGTLGDPLLVSETHLAALRELRVLHEARLHGLRQVVHALRRVRVLRGGAYRVRGAADHGQTSRVHARLHEGRLARDACVLRGQLTGRLRDFFFGQVKLLLNEVNCVGRERPRCGLLPIARDAQRDLYLALRHLGLLLVLVVLEADLVVDLVRSYLLSLLAVDVRPTCRLRAEATPFFALLALLSLLRRAQVAVVALPVVAG